VVRSWPVAYRNVQVFEFEFDEHDIMPCQLPDLGIQCGQHSQNASDNTVIRCTGFGIGTVALLVVKVSNAPSKGETACINDNVKGGLWTENR
jgi:hypothetical protein